MYWCCVWLKQIDTVICNVDAAKVGNPLALNLRQYIDEWFLVRIIMRRYRDFFAPTLLELSGGSLLLEKLFVNL